MSFLECRKGVLQLMQIIYKCFNSKDYCLSNKRETKEMSAGPHQKFATRNS